MSTAAITKELPTLTISGRQVTITYSRISLGVKITAVCGEITRESTLTLHPNAARTAAEVQADITALAQRLADEAAGHDNNREVLDSLFAFSVAEEASTTPAASVPEDSAKPS